MLFLFVELVQTSCIVHDKSVRYYAQVNCHYSFFLSILSLLHSKIIRWRRRRRKGNMLWSLFHFSFSFRPSFVFISFAKAVCMYVGCRCMCVCVFASSISCIHISFFYNNRILLWLFSILWAIKGDGGNKIILRSIK